MRVFDSSLDHLGVGCAGKVGVLDLGLARVAGVTRVIRQYQQSPLYCFHALYVDAGWRDMAFVYMQQAGEGILQGDRYRLDLECAPGTAAHFTTPAATKIYRMEQSFASQIVNITAGAGAFVEYLPDPVVPFRGSRFYQRMSLTVDPAASVILAETLLPGRVARGEAHAYALHYTDLEAYTPDGSLLFADRLKLEPHAISPKSPGRFGAYDVLASFYVLTHRLRAGSLVDRLRDRLADLSGTMAGVSELPNGAGASLRVLGRSSSDVAAAIRTAWNEARLALAGVSAPDLRKR